MYQASSKTVLFRNPIWSKKCRFSTTVFIGCQEERAIYSGVT